MHNNQLWLDSCWFCGKNKAATKAAIDVGMYRVIDKVAEDNSLMAMMNIKWENATVLVPRCAYCKSVHNRRQHYIRKGHRIDSIIGLIVAALVYLNLVNETDIPVMIAIVAASISGLISWVISRTILHRDVKGETWATEYPHVKRKEEEGWEIGDRP